MFAQVIQGGTTPELRDEMDRIVREKMLPALQVEPGSSGPSTWSTAGRSC
jgi:hypothetical protein